MKILSAVINNIETDQRVDKVCYSLLKFGYNIELIGTTLRGKPTLNKPYKTSLIPLKYEDSFKLYAEFNLKLFFRLLKTTDRNTILLANDLDSLLPFYLVSKIKNRPLVFDSHEIFSELPSLQNKPKIKLFWKTLERFLLPKITYFYTVSNGYANWFKENYNVNPVVIRNVPILNRNTEIVSEFSLPPIESNNKIILYQGALNISRGLEYAIKAMPMVKNAVLWIVGNGPIKKDLEQLVNTLNLTHRVFFLGHVTPAVLKQITPLADLGISLEEDLGISYKYALPNKVFDYFQAGVPLLATYLPEIKATVLKYKVGRVIKTHNEQHIANEINILLTEGKQKYKDNLLIASKECCWENEENKLQAIFNQISAAVR